MIAINFPIAGSDAIIIKLGADHRNLKTQHRGSY